MLNKTLKFPLYTSFDFVPPPFQQPKNSIAQIRRHWIHPWENQALGLPQHHLPFPPSWWLHRCVGPLCDGIGFVVLVPKTKVNQVTVQEWTFGCSPDWKCWLVGYQYKCMRIAYIAIYPVHRCFHFTYRTEWTRNLSRILLVIDCGHYNQYYLQSSDILQLPTLPAAWFC